MPAVYPDSYRRVVEQNLRQFFPRSNSRTKAVYRAMRYSLFSGGKRLRPILTMLAAKAVSGDPFAVIPTACAVEYIHTYSLIHDDLPAMDNDSLRRGKPTCHIKYGEDIAILAGDALLTEAFFIITKEQKTKAERILMVIKELTDAVGVRGMVGGQTADINKTSNNNIKTVEYIHKLKTGRLIAAAARCGAILAGASAPALEAVTNYAANLGLAFQITDDILDVTGTAAVLGKNVGSDAKLNKATFPAILGVTKSQEFAIRAIAKAKKALNTTALREKKALIDLADFVIERNK